MQSKYEVTELAPKHIRSPRLIWAYEYWLSQKGSRRMPARADIRPEDMKPILGRTMLVQVNREPFGLSYALFGTEVVRQYGQDMTGRDVTELMPDDFAEMIVELYKQSIKSHKPGVHSVTSLAMERAYTFERLALPLSSDGSEVDRFITVTEYKKPLRQRLSEEAGGPFAL